MTPRIEFLFDFGSPNAFLSHRVLPEVAARCGAEVDHVPVLLGGIFKATGNVSPAVSLRGIRNKPEYMALETRRFVERHGIADFRMNPHFPVNTLALMRGAIHAQREGSLADYMETIYRNMWVEPKKLDDPDVFSRVLSDSGLDAQAFSAAIADPEVKAALIANTERAVERGVFGIPSFFVGDELFFGKDRLRDVEEEVARQSGR